jgi:hypothetical protein
MEHFLVLTGDVRRARDSYCDALGKIDINIGAKAIS